MIKFSTDNLRKAFEEGLRHIKGPEGYTITSIRAGYIHEQGADFMVSVNINKVDEREIEENA